MKATKEIKAGERIFVEEPLDKGPMYGSHPVCLGQAYFFQFFHVSYARLFFTSPIPYHWPHALNSTGQWAQGTQANMTKIQFQFKGLKYGGSSFQSHHKPPIIQLQQIYNNNHLSD